MEGLIWLDMGKKIIRELEHKSKEIINSVADTGRLS